MKLARYAEFYLSRSAAGNELPVLLFVTTTPQREELVWRVAAATLGEANCQLLTTTASLLDRLGPFAAIWRSPTASHRTRWPTSAAIDATTSGGTP
jgi:hypothetical protein